MENTKESQFITYAKSVYADSVEAKSSNKGNVEKWRKMYKAKAVKGKTKRSTVVSKDVMRQINILKPLLVNPFMKVDKIVTAKSSTLNGTRIGGISAGLINHQWNEEFDKLTFLRNISNVFPLEGVVITKTVWDTKVKKKKEVLKGLSPEQVMILDAKIQDDDKVEVKTAEQLENGLFNVTLIKSIVLKDSPKTVVSKYDNIFVDPSAETMEDARFVQEEYKMTISDIYKQSHIYDTSKIDQILAHCQKDNTTAFEESEGTNHRNSFEITDNTKAMVEVTLVDYWGEYDLDGDGIADQVVCTYVKDSDIVIRFEENPLPTETHPYDAEFYDPVNGSFDSDGLAESIEDLVNTRTAFKRSFIDNASLSNNGQKFFKKGALDATNYKALLSGERFIEVNYDVKEAVQDGQFNQIPQTAFALYENEKSEIKEVSGIDDSLSGNISATVGRTSGGVSQVMGAAKERIGVTLSAVMNLLEKIFSKWAVYNSEFIDNGKIINIGGQATQITKDMLAEEAGNFSLKVITAAGSQEMISQINMLLQQSGQLGQKVPDDVFTNLVSELFVGMGKIEASEKVLEHKPEADPHAQALKALEIELKQAEIDELKSKIKLNEAKAYKEKGEGIEKEIDNRLGKKEEPAKS